MTTQIRYKTVIVTTALSMSKSLSCVRELGLVHWSLRTCKQNWADSVTMGPVIPQHIREWSSWHVKKEGTLFEKDKLISKLAKNNTALPFSFRESRRTTVIVTSFGPLELPTLSIYSSAAYVHCCTAWIKCEDPLLVHPHAISFHPTYFPFTFPFTHLRQSVRLGVLPAVPPDSWSWIS